VCRDASGTHRPLRLRYSDADRRGGLSRSLATLAKVLMFFNYIFVFFFFFFFFNHGYWYTGAAAA